MRTPQYISALIIAFGLVAAALILSWQTKASHRLLSGSQIHYLDLKGGEHYMSAPDQGKWVVEFADHYAVATPVVGKFSSNPVVIPYEDVSMFEVRQ